MTSGNDERFSRGCCGTDFGGPPMYTHSVASTPSNYNLRALSFAAIATTEKPFDGTGRSAPEAQRPKKAVGGVEVQKQVKKPILPRRDQCLGNGDTVNAMEEKLRPLWGPVPCTTHSPWPLSTKYN